VLEATSFDGRARTFTWAPAEGRQLATPALAWPENSLVAKPAWVGASLTANPQGGEGIEIVSGGTWFHPTGATGALVVAPPQPAPTATVQVLAVGEELAVFHDAAGWAGNPKELVKGLIQAKAAATAGRLLWAPGVGTPEDYALWAYLGVDLFDASPLLLAATRGHVLTTDGAMDAERAAAVFGGSWDFERIAAHNLEAARVELALVASHIRGGTLRGLVERRIYSKPASVEVLRRFDREHAYLEAAAPRHRAQPLPAMTSEALWMPEVEAFRRRLRDRYAPPRGAKVLLLMPCSQRKPYKTSRSHRAMARPLDDSGIRHLIHEVMVTSPLGLVPRDLEEVYPANQYDIPVTGHWTQDEEEIVRTQLSALLAAHDYDHVVVHAGQATFDVMRDLLPENVRHTCLHHPTSPEDLQRLRDELARLAPLLGPTDARAAGRDRKLEDIRALLTFQFGPAVADELTADAKAVGRMPFVKLLRDDAAETQLGTTTPDRGVVSLTVEGAKVLAKHATKRVFIGDFRPKNTSSLFAVGVEGADPDVRAGDEVVVLHKDEVRGCGVALMDAESMTRLKRGVAVGLRHTAPSAAAAPKGGRRAEPPVVQP
jgi:archaeosine synthase alpha-subunit